jgi:hypothetical protein
MMELPPPADSRLPAPAPAAARAAISPSALALAGAGTAVGLVVGLPAVAVVVLAAGLWGVRVAAGTALAWARRRRARRPEVMDPYAVPDPWRSFVRESLTAQTKFDQAVARSHPGPLRERMTEVSGRIHEGVRECWRVAHLGAALTATLNALNPDERSEDLRRFQAAGVSTPAPDLPPEAVRAREETEAAMAAQLQAARRVEAAAQRAIDRLRVLTAELNAAVAGAVELSLDGDAAAAAANELAGSVDSVVGEIETLRLALEETAGSAKPTARPS